MTSRFVSETIDGADWMDELAATAYGYFAASHSFQFSVPLIAENVENPYVAIPLVFAVSFSMYVATFQCVRQAYMDLFVNPDPEELDAIANESLMRDIITYRQAPDRQSF